jgi:hypothetical protein
VRGRSGRIHTEEFHVERGLASRDGCRRSGGWSGPQTVVQLAQSLYDGQDCRLPLSDALEETGFTDLATHFRDDDWHPKGCWVIDMILGKS